jgi:hypothetical protein
MFHDSPHIPGLARALSWLIYPLLPLPGRRPCSLGELLSHLCGLEDLRAGSGAEGRPVRTWNFSVNPDSGVLMKGI